MESLNVTFLFGVYILMWHKFCFDAPFSIKIKSRDFSFSVYGVNKYTTNVNSLGVVMRKLYKKHHVNENKRSEACCQ